MRWLPALVLLVGTVSAGCLDLKEEDTRCGAPTSTFHRFELQEGKRSGDVWTYGIQVDDACGYKHHTATFSFAFDPASDRCVPPEDVEGDVFTSPGLAPYTLTVERSSGKLSPTSFRYSGYAHDIGFGQQSDLDLPKSMAFYVSFRWTETAGCLSSFGPIQLDLTYTLAKGLDPPIDGND